MIQTFLIPAILIGSKNLNIPIWPLPILTHQIAKKSPGANTMVVGTKTVLAVVTPGFTKRCLCIWRCPWCYQSKKPPNHVQSDHGKRNPTCEAHHTHRDAACVWCMFWHFTAYNQLYSEAAVEHISFLTLTLPLVSYPSQVIIPSSFDPLIHC